MLSKNITKATKLTCNQVRSFGNFEQAHPIPPRYFLVKYQIDQRQFREKVLDASDAKLAIDHAKKVKDGIAMQKIVFRGEMLPERSAGDDGGDSDAAHVSQTNEIDEIIFVFNARDEREPHEFIMADPLYSEGIVKEWDISELDIIHRDRDDELTITGKF